MRENIELSKNRNLLNISSTESCMIQNIND